MCVLWVISLWYLIVKMFIWLILNLIQEKLIFGSSLIRCCLDLFILQISRLFLFRCSGVLCRIFSIRFRLLLLVCRFIFGLQEYFCGRVLVLLLVMYGGLVMIRLQWWLVRLLNRFDLIRVMLCVCRCFLFFLVSDSVLLFRLMLFIFQFGQQWFMVMVMQFELVYRFSVWLILWLVSYGLKLYLISLVIGECGISVCVLFLKFRLVNQVLLVRQVVGMCLLM